LVFLAVGLLLIAGVCGLLIGLPLLRNTRQYFVRFNEPVAGISKGSEVKYQGVKKGRVKRYTIDYDTIQFELEMDADLHVTETTVALITSEGILPPYFIELRGSVRGSPELPEGSIIKTDPSMTATIRQRGMEIADSFQAVLKNIERWTGPENEQKLVKLLEESASAMTTANQTMTTIRPEAERMVRSYADAGEELAKLISENREALHAFIEESRQMAAELNRFMSSGKLDQVSLEASRTLESVRADFNKASAGFTKFLEDTKIDERLERVVASLERAEKDLASMSGTVRTEMSGLAQGELLSALRSFREAMTSFEQLARVLRDDPSLVIFSRPRSEIRIPQPGDK
jgi:phospholipid/cholesterol/gamma-HCH transport system substrate-binding protein